MFLFLSRAGLPFQRRALATTALILEDGRNGMKLASHGCIGSLIAYYRDIHDPTNTATEGSAQVLIPDILEAISLIASFACSMEDLHKILALLRDEFNCKVREKSVEKFVITARKSSTKTVLSDRSISYGTIGPNGWEKAADLDSLSSIASGDTSILSTVSYGTTPSFLNDNPGSILASSAVSSHHGTLHGSHNGIQHGPQHGTHNGIKHGIGRPNCARSILDCLTVVTRNSGDPSVVFDMRSSGTAFMGIPMPDMGEVKGYSLGVWVMFEEIDDRSSPIQLFYWEDSADRPILDISICLNGKDFVLSIKIADHHSIQTSLSIALHQWHFILFHHVYHVLKSSELLVYCDGARVCAHNVQYPQLARASSFAYCGWRPLVNRVGEVGRKASAVRSMWKLASIMMIEGSIRDQSVKSLFECDRDFMVLDDLAVQCDVFAMLSQSPDSRNLHPSLRQSMVFFYHARNLDFSPEDNLELKLNASQDPRCKIAPANSQRLPHFTNANVPATLHGDCFVLTPKSFSSAVRQCGGLQLFFEFIDKCKTSEQLSQLTTLLHGLLRNDFKNVCIMNSPCGLFDATGFQMFHFLLSQKRSLLNKECVGALLGYMGIPNAPRTLPERALQVIALINLGESALFHCSPETSSMFYQELVNMMVVSPMKWQTIKIFQDISMVRIILDVLQSKDFFDISLGGPVSVIREMLSLGDDRPQFVQDIHWDLQLVVDCVMSWNIKRTYVQKSDPTLSAHLDKCCAALLEMLVDVAMQTKTLRRLQILQYYMKRAYIFALFEGSSPESSSNGGAESGQDSLKMSRSTFHALHLLWVFLYLDSEYFIQFRQNAGFSALCHVLTKFHGDPQLYVMLFLMMEKHPLELTSPDKYSFWSKRELVPFLKCEDQEHVRMPEIMEIVISLAVTCSSSSMCDNQHNLEIVKQLFDICGELTAISRTHMHMCRSYPLCLKVMECLLLQDANSSEPGTPLDNSPSPPLKPSSPHSSHGGSITSDVELEHDTLSLSSVELDPDDMNLDSGQSSGLRTPRPLTKPIKESERMKYINLPKPMMDVGKLSMRKLAVATIDNQSVAETIIKFFSQVLAKSFLVSPLSFETVRAAIAFRKDGVSHVVEMHHKSELIASYISILSTIIKANPAVVFKYNDAIETMPLIFRLCTDIIFQDHSQSSCLTVLKASHRIVAALLTAKRQHPAMQHVFRYTNKLTLYCLRQIRTSLKPHRDKVLNILIKNLDVMFCDQNADWRFRKAFLYYTYSSLMITNSEEMILSFLEIWGWLERQRPRLLSKFFTGCDRKGKVISTAKYEFVSSGFEVLRSGERRDFETCLAWLRRSQKPIRALFRDLALSSWNKYQNHIAKQKANGQTRMFKIRSPSIELDISTHSFISPSSAYNGSQSRAQMRNFEERVSEARLQCMKRENIAEARRNTRKVLLDSKSSESWVHIQIERQYVDSMRNGGYASVGNE
eukprot:458137_1